jgi:hypothetical protein
VGFGAAVVVVASLSRWKPYPGASSGERRDAQVARGLAARESGVAHATIRPCAYEHFAFIAAFGAPERVTVLASPTPAGAAAATVTDACPVLEP